MGKPMTQQEKDYYQAILNKNGLAGLSGIYYKLEKAFPDTDRITDYEVYLFKTTSNGNFIVEYKEERSYSNESQDIRHHVYNGKAQRVSREQGNEMYMKLQNEGFTFSGKYVQDICGYKVKL